MRERVFAFSSYEGYRTAVAYVPFVPKTGGVEEALAEGVDYKRKVIYGYAQFIVFATSSGTIFGILPRRPGT